MALPLCPCCGLTPETAIHLLTCPAPTIRDARLQSLTRFFDWLRDWETHSAVITAIQALCQDSPCCPLSILNSPDPDLPYAFAQQLSFGTSNFWHGRHTRLWECIQSAHYHSVSSHRSGRAWAAGLVRHILEVSHSVWLARNDIVHARHLRGTNIVDSSQLTAAITEQFSLGSSSLLAADKHLLDSRPIATILALPADQKRLWLASLTLARELGAESMQSDQHQMSEVMRRWLGQ